MSEIVFARLKSDPATLLGGRAVSEADIQRFESVSNITLPESYRRFLLNFGESGEFVFGRMRRLFDDEQVEAFWECWGPRLGPDARARYLPFADDYSRYYYCFELEKRTHQDCPIILVDYAIVDAPGSEERFTSFFDLISMALNNEGIFSR